MTPKSDRAQILIAVLFMSLFASAFVLGIAVKDNITGFICRYEVLDRVCTALSPSSLPISSDPLITSQITSACVGDDGLQISVDFGPPSIGEASIQVFTTGEDVFPSELGMQDSFGMSMTMSDAADQLGFVIPVESMPVGEHIFGNIVVTNEGAISSHVAFFIRVSDCSSADTVASNPTLLAADASPIAYRTTCLPDNRLMIAFEFDTPMFGQYQTLIASLPYQLVSVGNQPAILFFSGDAPVDEPAIIRLISVTTQTVLLEESFTPPVCDPE
jgi:hypothetical protein